MTKIPNTPAVTRIPTHSVELAVQSFKEHQSKRNELQNALYREEKMDRECLSNLLDTIIPEHKHWVSIGYNSVYDRKFYQVELNANESIVELFQFCSFSGGVIATKQFLSVKYFRSQETPHLLTLTLVPRFDPHD